MAVPKINVQTALLVLIWLAVNIGDGFWMYFYTMSYVQPNPHTAVNRTYKGFQAYKITMFLFGWIWSPVNVLVYWAYFAWALTSRRGRSICIGLPLTLFIIIIPAFGGWIVVPIVERWAWNHRCDSYPMFAVLDGRGYYDASYVPNVVHFYSGKSLHATPLFTYIINSDSDSDLWTFELREFDNAQDQIPLDYYPTLQSVQYDFLNDTLTGNCTTPVAPGSSITNSTTCMTGTYNPNDWLSFNISSNIPLNNTVSGSPVPPTTAVLRTVDKQWTYDNDAPSLILKTVDPLTNSLQRQVLCTAVGWAADCTQLKVCLAGTGTPGGLIGAEVLAPLGLVMIRQGDHAATCGQPDDD
ncbi:hypothetical protein EUX98_g498 [Antrodiella citrinella]|uniref:Uncharacterized protein n=1 Tax=Antrodiella citrinella TaxID=2447956 RepID=A0A4S4N600_9APHY|nr:hypothetical protein EUX98_g498 [Antrodiella citrinella]